MIGSWPLGILFSLILLEVHGATSAATQDVVENQPERFSNFDMELTKLVAKENSNVALSPISVKLALAMIFEGAKGNTSKQLQQVLQFKDAKALSPNQLSKVLQSFQATTEGYDIAVGTKLFIDRKASPTPAFEKRIKMLYNGTIEKINFQKTEEAVMRINSWAETVTRGHVQNLLSESNSQSNTVLLLVNALYFKGAWENPFPLKQTEEGMFHVDGELPEKVQFMNSVLDLYYIESSDLNCSVVRLPYQGGKFAMYILLPFDKTGLPSLVQNMTPEKMRKTVDDMQLVTVQLKLPKFKFEFSANLGPALKEMGLTEMFSPNADLSGIAESNRDLVVSNVIQKTALEVNEQGSTAAVATGIEVANRFGTYNAYGMNITHPFILYIQDETTDTVVFVAKVTNPVSSGSPTVSSSTNAPVERMDEVTQNSTAGKPTA